MLFTPESCASAPKLASVTQNHIHVLHKEKNEVCILISDGALCAELKVKFCRKSHGELRVFTYSQTNNLA